MGKFQIKKIEKREEFVERNREILIKLSLQTKPLLDPIPLSPSKKSPIKDGILLFGKHRGRKISELLISYEDSSYVFEYLLINKDLPKKFRQQIAAIIDNQDPFESPAKIGPMKARCVGSITGKEFYNGETPPWEDECRDYEEEEEEEEQQIPW